MSVDQELWEAQTQGFWVIFSRIQICVFEYFEENVYFKQLNYLMEKTGRLFAILTCSCAVSLTFCFCVGYKFILIK